MFELASCGDAWQDAATDTNDPERRQQKAHDISLEDNVGWSKNTEKNGSCGHHLNAIRWVQGPPVIFIGYKTITLW